LSFLRVRQGSRKNFAFAVTGSGKPRKAGVSERPATSRGPLPPVGNLGALARDTHLTRWNAEVTGCRKVEKAPPMA
jgi:hypothetical protein